MEKMKRILAALMVGTSLFALTACGGSDGETAQEGGEGGEEAVEKIVIQAGYGNNPGEPTDLAMQRWKR